MLRFLPALTLVVPALILAEEPTGNSKDRDKAFALLPPGSQLKGVMMPRYDENRKLTGVLKSKVIRLVNADEIAGESVTIEFFNEDETPRGRIDLAHATLNEKKQMLVANEMVDIRADGLTARGTALHYSFKDGEGFLSGPVTTIVQAPIETTMNSKIPSLRGTTLIGMSLLAQSLPAAPPSPISAEEKAAVQADVRSSAPAVARKTETTRARLAKDMADSDAASQAATRFLVQADLPAPTADEVPAPAAPLEIKPGPGDSVISCEGGMYFDPEEGVMVYLKNVKVTDPRFTLTAQDQLKAFFGKKPPKPEADKAQKDTTASDAKDSTSPEPKKAKKKDPFGGSIGVDFGKPERIIATGAVVFKQIQTEPDQKPIQASGAVFSYNIKEDQIIISGGKPWVLQPPSTYLRAKEAGLSLRISPKAGSFVTEGHWEMGGNIEEASPKDKKENKDN